MIADVTDVAAIAARAHAIRERVDAAARRAGRDPGEITLIGAAKTHPPSAIAAAVDAGIRDIGENRVQEWRDKRDALAAQGAVIRWHFIGTLQKNKVRAVVGEVVLIHSVDSPALAEAIGARARQAGTVQDVLLEVNVAAEPSKHGVGREEAEAVAARLDDIGGVRLRGFMTIPPPGDPSAARAAFGWIRGLRDRLAPQRPALTELSMGMSEDFEVGIEEGSTMVRIGTAIFGPRDD